MTGYLSLMTLVVHLALSVLSVPVALADRLASSEISGLLGNRILICSPGGYKWVTADELDRERDNYSKQGSPDCSLFNTASQTPPFIDFVQPAFITRDITDSFRAETLHRTSHKKRLLLSRGAFSTAPPALS